MNRWAAISGWAAVFAGLAVAGFKVIGDDPRQPRVAVAEGVTLKVEPSTTTACSPPAVGTVTWDATKTGLQPLVLWVRVPEGAEAAFAPATPSGSVPTGAWIRPRTTIMLRDLTGRKELASFRVGQEPCGGS